MNTNEVYSCRTDLDIAQYMKKLTYAGQTRPLLCIGKKHNMNFATCMKHAYSCSTDIDLAFVCEKSIFMMDKSEVCCVYEISIITQD